MPTWLACPTERASRLEHGGFVMPPLAEPLQRVPSAHRADESWNGGKIIVGQRGHNRAHLVPSPALQGRASVERNAGQRGPLLLGEGIKVGPEGARAVDPLG